MKTRVSLFIAGFMFIASSSAFAKKMQCEIIGASQSLGEASEDMHADELTAIVDTTDGTAKLISSNELYGKNPYLTLKTAPQKISNLYKEGNLVLSGKNAKENNELLVLVINEKTKEGSYEIFSKFGHVVADVYCK